jgi:hypothetical protein
MRLRRNRSSTKGTTTRCHCLIFQRPQKSLFCETHPKAMAAMMWTSWATMLCTSWQPPLLDSLTRDDGYCYGIVHFVSSLLCYSVLIWFIFLFPFSDKLGALPCILYSRIRPPRNHPRHHHSRLPRRLPRCPPVSLSKRLPKKRLPRCPPRYVGISLAIVDLDFSRNARYVFFVRPFSSTSPFSSH